ncbi:autoinducer binding domain-containing protein [Pseudomonas chlororaphis]|uniref:autoinducer binding domain-containing protein n=1 Tax=Pseudomonas chlororaphis TaxID=587753 RepID=UPI001E5C15CD|nr:autoinducer binding domain-containing protein [Pseudomonas chlororaphis]MCB2254099.1 autoinducer binding domain-containing protein [Pseudomonas chlororaphis]
MEKQQDFMHWWNDLRMKMLTQQESAQVFALLEREVRQLGFDFYAYGVRHSIPFTRPKTEIYSSYPQPWMERYQQQNYAAIDPAILNGLRSAEMVIWNDALFGKGSLLWGEAREWGLRVGATLPIRTPDGGLSLLSVARESGAISLVEREEIRLRLRCIIELVIQRLGELGHPSSQVEPLELSPREREILQWTADGKSSGEIALILGISVNTVNFHLKVIQKKFGATNKTLAAAYAAVLRLI